MKTLCSKANNKLTVLSEATPYMSVEKRTLFSRYSLITAHLYGCYTAVGITISYGIYMNSVLGQYTMTKTHLMKNHLLKMAQSIYITEIYRLWQPNCTKLKMDFRQNLLLKFLIVKQSLITR